MNLSKPIQIVCALLALSGCTGSSPTTDLPTSEILFDSKVTVDNQSNTIDYVVYLDKRKRFDSLEPNRAIELSATDKLFLVDQIGKTEFKSVGNGDYEITGREFFAGTSLVVLERSLFSETITVEYSVPGQILLTEPSSRLAVDINDEVFVSWLTEGNVITSELSVDTPRIHVSNMRCFDTQNLLLTDEAFASIRSLPRYPRNDGDTSATIVASEIFTNEYRLTESEKSEIVKCTALIGATLPSLFNQHVIGFGDVYVRGDSRYANDEVRSETTVRTSYGTIDVRSRLEEVEFIF